MTIRTRWLLALLVITRLAMPGYSQAPAAVAASVSRALAAYGAALNSGAIQDWICEGTLTLFSSSGPKTTLPVTLLRKGRSQVQRLITQDSKVQRQGSDGITAWDSVDGFRTVAQGRTLLFLEGQTIRSIQALLGYQAAGVVLRDLGGNGKSQFIEAEDGRGRKTRYNLDVNSAVVSEIEFSTEAVSLPDQQMPALTEKAVFSDYRRVQGILTPFKTERYLNGVKVEEMQFTSVRYNAAIKDSDFKP